jgi:hypothetical protein
MKKFICVLLCLCSIATPSSAEFANRQKIIAAFSLLSLCAVAGAAIWKTHKENQREYDAEPEPDTMSPEQEVALILYDTVRMLVNSWKESLLAATLARAEAVIAADAHRTWIERYQPPLPIGGTL